MCYLGGRDFLMIGLCFRQKVRQSEIVLLEQMFDSLMLNELGMGLRMQCIFVSSPPTLCLASTHPIRTQHCDESHVHTRLYTLRTKR